MARSPPQLNVSWNTSSQGDRLTLRRQVPKRSGTIALHLDARRVGERNKHLANAHLEQLRLEVVCRQLQSIISGSFQLTAERQNRNTSCHLALDRQWDLQHQILDPLHRASLDDRALVPLATSSEVTQRRDRVALHLLVLVE